MAKFADDGLQLGLGVTAPGGVDLAHRAAEGVAQPDHEAAGKEEHLHRTSLDARVLDGEAALDQDGQGRRGQDEQAAKTSPPDGRGHHRREEGEKRRAVVDDWKHGKTRHHRAGQARRTDKQALPPGRRLFGNQLQSLEGHIPLEGLSGSQLGPVG